VAGEEDGAADGAGDVVVGLGAGLIDGAVGAVEGLCDDLLVDDLDDVDAEADDFLEGLDEECVVLGALGCLLGADFVGVGWWFDEDHRT
jgi:hypothetical protein